MSSFFGFKLHMIINDIGQIIAIKLTKGYIGAGLFKALYKKEA